jgi:hypothetical protein
VLETNVAALVIVSGVRASDLGVFTKEPFGGRCMITPQTG